MTPRKYELQRRAEAAAETRRRIVEATMRVHDRRGISQSTLREIAEEADVSPGTVLRHFPEMGDLVTACGAMTSELFPFPGTGVLDGTEGRARLRAAVAAVFGFWDAAPQVWPMVEGERRHWPPVDEAVRRDEETRRALLDAALPRGRSKARARQLALALALTTWNSRAALRGEGLDLDAATDAVVDALLAAGATAPAR